MAERFYGFVVLAELAVRHAQPIVGHRVARMPGNDLSITVDGVFVFAPIGVGRGEPGMSDALVGIEFDGPPIFRNRFIELTLPFQFLAEFEAGRRGRAVDGYRVPKRGRSFCKLPFSAIGDALVDVIPFQRPGRLRMARAEPQYLAVRLQRVFDGADLLAHDSEAVMRLHVIGVHLLEYPEIFGHGFAPTGFTLETSATVDVILRRRSHERHGRQSQTRDEPAGGRMKHTVLALCPGGAGAGDLPGVVHKNVLPRLRSRPSL